jgi:hypothetical protein
MKMDVIRQYVKHGMKVEPGWAIALVPVVVVMRTDSSSEQTGSKDGDAVLYIPALLARWQWRCFPPRRLQFSMQHDAAGFLYSFEVPFEVPVGTGSRNPIFSPKRIRHVR